MLLRMHDGLPTVFADMIMWITSPKRRSRRVNVYKLAQMCELYVDYLRGMLAPFESAGLIKYVGNGLNLLNKMEIDYLLENFWGYWVLPSLDPYSLVTDIERISSRSLNSIFQDGVLNPYLKGLRRKSKELVVWSLIYRIFKTKESFKSYQYKCIDNLSERQKELYDALGESGLNLIEAYAVCGSDEKLLSELIESLNEQWLMRLIWQNENGVMRWRIVRFDYERLKQDIHFHHGNDSHKDDRSMYKMLRIFKYANNKRLENKNILLWDYYFERVDKDWHALTGDTLSTFRHFVEWWHYLFGQGSVDNLNIRSGIYQNNEGKFRLLLIQSPFERYVQHAVKWELINKKEAGFGLMSLGVCYADKMRAITKGIKAIWARNQDRLTIVLSDGMEFCEHNWLDRLSKKIDTRCYLITPTILHSKEIDLNELLSIVGSIIPLLPRQAERLASWFNKQDKV